MRCDAVHHADCVRRVALARAVGFLGRQRSAETGGSAQPSFVRRAWLQFLTRSADPALRFVADPEMSVNVMCCMDTMAGVQGEPMFFVAENQKSDCLPLQFGNSWNAYQGLADTSKVLYQQGNMYHVTLTYRLRMWTCLRSTYFATCRCASEPCCRVLGVIPLAKDYVPMRIDATTGIVYLGL